jgi:hypothetical protein
MLAKRPPLALFQVQTLGGVYAVESVMVVFQKWDQQMGQCGASTWHSVQA